MTGIDQESFATLGHMVEAAPDRLDDVITLAESVRKSSEHFIDTCAQRQGQVATLLATLRTRIQQETQHSEELRAKLQGHVDSLEQEMRALSTQLGEARTRIVELGQAATGTLEELGAAIDQGRSAMEEAAGATAAVLDESHERDVAAREAQKASHSNMTEAGHELDASLAAAPDELEPSAKAIAEQIDVQKETAATKIEDAKRVLDELRAHLEEKFEEASSGILLPTVDDLGKSVEQAITERLARLVKEAVAAVVEALEEMIGRVKKAGAEASEVRKAMEGVISELDVLIKPLEALIEEIKNVAEKFGIDFA